MSKQGGKNMEENLYIWKEDLENGNVKNNINNFIFLYGHPQMTLERANKISESMFYKFQSECYKVENEIESKESSNEPIEQPSNTSMFPIGNLEEYLETLSLKEVKSYIIEHNLEIDIYSKSKKETLIKKVLEARR